MQEKTKAKRKLKGFDFATDGAAVALVGPSVGGPANGIPTLIAKSNNFSPEFIQKMQQIQVTYELPEFLRKVFGMYYEDAEILAKMLGYVKPEVEVAEYNDDWYDNYLEEKLSAFTILKSLHDSKNLPEALSKLTEQDYMDVLNDQVVIEKAMKELALEADTSTKVEKQVEASASKVTKKKEKQMTQATDMVEKDKFVAVEKALEDQKVALEKALAQVKQYEEAQVAAVVKSKTEAVQAVVKDEKQAAVVVKAALALQDQADFDALIEVFKSMNVLIEKGALFQEQGADATVTEDAVTKTPLQKALEAKFAAKKQ